MINDYASMIALFIMSLSILAGWFGRDVTTYLDWEKDYDEWKEAKQIPCYALNNPSADDKRRIIVIDNIDDISPENFKRTYDNKEYTNFDEWAQAQAVNVTEKLLMTQYVQLAFTAFSLFINFPIKHYREYVIDKWKSKDPKPQGEKPNPLEAPAGIIALVWLLGMFGFTIVLAIIRFDPQVDICSGSLLSEEEKKQEANKGMYDLQIGGLTKGLAFVYSVICAMIVLGMLIFGLLYAIMGEDWVKEKFGDKDENES